MLAVSENEPKKKNMTELLRQQQHHIQYGIEVTRKQLPWKGTVQPFCSCGVLLRFGASFFASFCFCCEGNFGCRESELVKHGWDTDES